MIRVSRWLCVVAWLIAPLLVAAEIDSAVPAFPSVPPTPPEHAAATFRTLHGFSMQLIASEPLIADPVDVAYDEDGRAYVAEMRDYPYPEEKGAVPTEFPGRIALLEDRDGDGVYDTSHAFAEMLSWPTSVVCWKGGVYAAAAPDIWYFRDNDGDRIADERRRVFTGFSRDNVQGIMNGLRWGLDHRIYGAASGNGGKIQPVAGDATSINVTRHDFRFDPTRETFEAIPGGARFGNAFDDGGNRFVCNIRNPVQHVVVQNDALSRNPMYAPPPAVHDVAEAGDQLPVFRISPPEAWRLFRAQRWSAERINYPRSELIGAGFWTSSSGVTVYRGSAYPPEFAGNVFVGEVAGNLIHRQTLTPAGVTFTSRRADPDAEFVASTDIWFRPVNFVNAPDGTLHVLDMYRETIEHPWSIPDDIKSKLNLRSGNDRGRIYRLAPPGFRLDRPPQLSRASTQELVSLLEHPNAWHRETAQRLLFERHDEAAVPLIRALAAGSRSAVARLHAMYLLNGYQQLADDDLRARGSDPAADVRRHALALIAARLAKSPDLRETVLAGTADDSPPVRFQAAVALGGVPSDDRVADALAKLVARDASDPWIRAAVLSSAQDHAYAILSAMLRDGSRPLTPESAEVIRELSFYTAARGVDDAMQAASLLDRLPDDPLTFRFALVTGLGLGLSRQGKNFSALPAASARPEVQRLVDLRESARRLATDAASPAESRLAAVELFRFEAVDDAFEPLASLLDAREPLTVQLAAVRLLRIWPEPRIADTFATRWKQCSPSTRHEIVEALLSRTDWLPRLVAALKADEILPGQLAITQRARLVNAADLAVRDGAVALLGPAATSARSEIVQRYQSALRLQGDLARGEAVFKRECLTCHRMGAVGHDVGPNLNTIRHRSPEEILVHVFDPNRDVPPQFISHTVALRDGRVVTGLIVNESATALELLRAENARDTILRREIEEIASSEKSLMPEGMEEKLTPLDVADLLTYLLPSTGP